MANTEGMSDDALKDLLSTDSSPVVAAAAVSSRRRTGGSRAERLRRRDEAMRAQRGHRSGSNDRLSTGSDVVSEEGKVNSSNRPERFGDKLSAPRLHPSRAQMMDAWDEASSAPSATVIRSSRPPSIGAQGEERGYQQKTGQMLEQNHGGNMPLDKPDIPQPLEMPTKSNMKPVIKSGLIQERPMASPSMSASESGKKPSKFLQRRMQQKAGATAGGFPSLDVPIGTFSRKKRMSRETSTVSNPTAQRTGEKDFIALGRSSKFIGASSLATSLDVPPDGGGGISTGSTVDGMTRSEIMEGVAEIESALSSKSIAFLRERGRKKRIDEAANKMKEQEVSQIAMRHHLVQTTNKAANGSVRKVDKNQEAVMLASIQTEDDLDRAFAIANPAATSVLESFAPDVTVNGGMIYDLESATALLRSTSYRQSLLAAKTTFEMIKGRANVRYDSCDDLGELSPAKADAFPALLPVAVRCLLDRPQPRKHLQLCLYALQSIRYLADLFAHASHRVYTNTKDFDRNSDSMYQLMYMKDEVPAPKASSCYEAPLSQSEPREMDSPVDGALYATNSSAESANRDAKAFYSDPLWTLLTRMRIIPCLSRIIVPVGGLVHLLPDEIVSTTCNILSMLSLRSPGAACAIAQHKDILPAIVTLALSPGSSEGGFVVNTVIATPCLILLCTLARQSRSIASQTDIYASVVSYLHAILGMRAENEVELTTQKWSLVLWRELLRYGLAIPHLSTFLSLAAPHLSVESDLSSDYLAAFANICECVKVITQSKSDVGIKLTKEQANTLATAGAWLAPHVQSCANFLCEEGQSSFGSHPEPNNVKLVAARLCFLLSYSSASAPKDVLKFATVDESSREEKVQTQVDTSSYISVISRSTCVSSLHAVLKSGIVKSALDDLVKYAHVCDWKDAIPQSSVSIQREASLSALLVAFVSLLSHVANNDEGFSDSEANEIEQVQSLVADFIFVTQASLKNRQCVPNRDKPIALSRTCWIDAAQYSLCKFFLIHDFEDKIWIELHVIRDMVFSLLGRLKVGDESMAAVLLSQDSLFATEGLGGGDALPIQAMLLRELCHSTPSQVQLDHSFKLHRGHGITSTGKGAFGLESLRSVADIHRPLENQEDDNFTQPLIPLGKVWLWQVLSSTINSSPQTSAEQRFVLLSSGMAVITSCLELLSSMEESCSAYSSQIPQGTKLYHLSNCCFFPEEILRKEQFDVLFSGLFTKYASMDLTGTHHSIANSFISACSLHSQTSRRNGNSPNAKEEDDEKLLDLFVTSGGNAFTKQETMAFMDFVGDMCTAYMEYGAQYNALNYVMRFLLRPAFPGKARVDILTKLGGLLHLLTFPDELADASGKKMLRALECTIVGGLSIMDGSPPEAFEVLNAFANVLSPGDGKSRHLDAKTGGYAYFLAIASLSRNLANCTYEKRSNGMESTRRRMQQLSPDAATSIYAVAKRLLTTVSGTKEDLIIATLEVCARKEIGTFPTSWDDALEELRVACSAERSPN